MKTKRIKWNRFLGKLPENAMRVDRATRYGNPYKLDEYSREESLRLFTLYLDEKLRINNDFLRPLINKDLACNCNLNEDCHGNILLNKVIEIYENKTLQG
jgi:hypothetical protein